MIAFITLCYSAIVWLVFFKLKWLPWNRGSQAGVVGAGVAGILVLVFAMNLFQPYSKDVRVYQKVIQIVPRVTGRVIALPVRANTPVEKGDVLFEIDPEPFQLEVDRLEANLELKAIVLKDAKALTGAAVAAEIKLDRARSEYQQAKARLGQAYVDLRETTVFAPADGVVTNLSLRPGQIASALASLPVMSFIESGTEVVIASFPQSALAYMSLGDPIEVALESFPGHILSGHVGAFVPGTGQGQLPPSGLLMEFTGQPEPGRFAVVLELDDPVAKGALRAGASGVAAIYTSRATAIRIIRKVVIRMTTWLNYVIL
jgi:multidrug resistance efflux pump